MSIFSKSGRTKRTFSFVMSGILAKQADEFSDEFGRCISQRHLSSLILQNRPDEFSDEFSDEFQTHR